MRELIAGMVLGYLSFSPKGKELVDSLVCKLSAIENDDKKNQEDVTEKKSTKILEHTEDFTSDKSY